MPLEVRVQLAAQLVTDELFAYKMRPIGRQERTKLAEIGGILW